MDDICAELDKLTEKNERAAMSLRAETKYKALAEELAKIQEEDDPEALMLTMIENADAAIDSFVDSLIVDQGSSDFIDAVAFKVSEEDLPVAREYIALMTLKKNQKTLDKIIDSFFYKEVNESKRLAALPTVVSRKFKGPVKKLILGELDAKLANAREALRLTGADLADSKDVFDEIRELRKEYDDAQASPYVVPDYHNGEMELVETDPIVSDNANYRYTASTSQNKLTENIGKTILAINRLARAMQTTFNPNSNIKNQGFRDPMNAFTVGGAAHLAKYFGNEIHENFINAVVEWVKRENPENWKALEAKAIELDTTPEALAVEMLQLRAAVNSTTMVQWLKEPYSKGPEAVSRGYWGDQIKQTKRAVGKVIDVLSKPAETWSDVREVGSRKAVIGAVLSKKLKSGSSVEEALRAAQFAGANATTNYGRMLVHFENFRRTVNYFGAGVNGFKSFWRMFELDPIGLMTRMNIGIIIPLMAATIFSLSNEKNRKVYRALREYDKKNQLVVVVDGRVYNIPIPQEMYGITSMVRSAVESLFDGNRHAFWELAMNDLLGFGPVDFSDFMDIDANRFGDDATFLERMGGLGLSFVNQFTDVATQSIIEAAFNIDTYTGKPIDTSYKQFDDEGNYIVVNPMSTGKFAEELGKFTGWSAPIISHTLKNVLGQVGRDVLNTIVGGQTPLDFAESEASSLVSLTGKNYDRITQEWNANVAVLWREKEGLLEAYNDYSSQINKEYDEERRKKLRADRQNLIDPFLNKVANAVKKLKEDYPGSYDQYRFASVVSLLNFDTGTTTGNTAEQRANSTDTYYDNLEQAYLWMQRLGIQSADDDSLLGYVTYDKKTGKPTVKYNMPTSILAAREAYMNKGDRNTAELRLILKTANIKSYDMTHSDEYKEAKAAGKAALKQYKADWNAKVVKEIAPYIREMGVDNVLANGPVMDILQDYLFVDSPYTARDYLTKIFKEAK